MRKQLLFISGAIGILIFLYCCKRETIDRLEEAFIIASLESEIDQLYRLDLLPQYRSGIVEQISSYDTTGLNDDGFSGKYSYIRKEDNKLVLADLTGPGVINRIWTPTPTTDTIQFYFDGEENPRINIPFIDLFSGKVFPFLNPVCGNEVGGYYCYIPIQYAKSCKVMYKGDHLQFHQIQYRSYEADTPVKTFSSDWSASEKASLDKACRFWNEEENPVRQLQESGAAVEEETKQFFMAPGEEVSFFSSGKGGRIVGIEIECGSVLESADKDVLLYAKWDNDPDPAVFCPAADFFGYAFGKPAMRSVLAGSAKGVNYCYLPMPFREKAELKIVYKKRENTAQSRIELNTKVYYLPSAQNEEIEGRLYSGWRREVKPEDYNPYLIADIEDKGHYVGTIHQAQGLQPGMTLFFEGDDSTVVDGKMRMHGTGSEDYYNGGWYALLDRWDRGVSLPIHGSLDYSLPMCRTGGYRFFLSDKQPFEKEYLLTIEHGPEHNLFPVDYTSVAFYYGTKPTLQVEPTAELRTVYYPSYHVFFPQLMDLSLGWDTWIENKGRLIASTSGEGLVRIMLNDIPEGSYKLSLTYFETPDGGSFSVWNRQKMIMDRKEVYANEEKRLEKHEIGIIRITPQTNSISLKINKTEKGNKFHFENLYLEKIEE